MVHGLPAKGNRTAAVQVDYVVNVLEIRPWPPSQSLKTIRSAIIQWENGERSSGTANDVAPQPGPVGDEGKIEFNDVVLSREIGKAGGSSKQLLDMQQIQTCNIHLILDDKFFF